MKLHGCLPKALDTRVVTALFTTSEVLVPLYEGFQINYPNSTTSVLQYEAIKQYYSLQHYTESRISANHQNTCLVEIQFRLVKLLSEDIAQYTIG